MLVKPNSDLGAEKPINAGDLVRDVPKCPKKHLVYNVPLLVINGVIAPISRQIYNRPMHPTEFGTSMGCAWKCTVLASQS